MSLKTRESVNKYYDTKIKATQFVIDKAQKEISRLKAEKEKRLKQITFMEKKERNVNAIRGNLKSLFSIKEKPKRKK